MLSLTFTPIIQLRRIYAILVAAIGGAVARSVFRDERIKYGSEQIGRIELAGSPMTNGGEVSASLELLATMAPGASKVVQRWVRRLGKYDAKWRWKHFCDGTLFVRSTLPMPTNRLAAYLYRVALQIALFKRWRRYEVVLDDPRCLLAVYIRELKLMNTLGCSDDYMQEQREYITRCLAKLDRKPSELIPREGEQN